MIYLVAISAGLLAFLVLMIFLRLLLKDRLILDKRLDVIGGKSDEDKPIKARKRKTTKEPALRALAYELSNAGVHMRPNEFLILWLTSAAIVPTLLALAGMHPVSSFAAALFGLALPPLFVRKRKKKRLILFEKQLGEALVLIANCLSAGMTFQQAMASVSSEMPNPIAHEFARTVKEIQFGTGVDIALDHLVSRVKSTDLMLTVSAIQIQRQVGGNLLEILENISVTIKDRIKIKDEIRVLVATGRSSGLIIGMIPIAIGGILALINPEYIMLFFQTQMGVTMLIVAATMEILGFLVIRKIVNIKY